MKKKKYSSIWLIKMELSSVWLVIIEFFYNLNFENRIFNFHVVYSIKKDQWYKTTTPLLHQVMASLLFYKSIIELCRKCDHDNMRVFFLDDLYITGILRNLADIQIKPLGKGSRKELFFGGFPKLNIQKYILHLCNYPPPSHHRKNTMTLL